MEIQVLQLKSVVNQFTTELCEFYLGIEDYRSAKQIAELILSNNPINPVALFTMGSVNETERNWSTELFYYEKLITNHPKNVKTRKRKALVEMHFKMERQALADINVAIDLDRKDPESLVIRGMISFYSFHLKIDAIVDYNEALSLKPQYPLALYHRGFAYLKYGNLEYAKDDFEKAAWLGYKDAQKMLEQYFPISKLQSTN